MSEAAANPIPRRGRLWVIAVLALAIFALGYAIVNIATQKAGRAVVQVAGIAEAQEIFGGVPQEGDRLGSSDAPVTIQVFNDLQCSSCRDDFLGTIPGLIEDYARPGRREAALRHYSVAENAAGARLLRRRGGRPAGLRLAVHLSLLPQPGRGRNGSASTRTSSTRSPASIGELERRQNGANTSKTDGGSGRRDHASGSKATTNSAPTSGSAPARRRSSPARTGPGPSRTAPAWARSSRRSGQSVVAARSEIIAASRGVAQPGSAHRSGR